MNKDNVLAVADAIEKHSLPMLGFNMNDYLVTADEDDDAVDRSGHNCSTVACIAGWTVAVQDGGAPAKWEGELHWHQAQDYLGLSRNDADRLFYAAGVSDRPMSEITPEQAVTVLRHLAETGEVDWSKAA